MEQPRRRSFGSKLLLGTVGLVACMYTYSFLCDQTLLWYRQRLIRQYSTRKEKLLYELDQDRAYMEELERRLHAKTTNK
jgi:hypothetical protein